MDRFWGVTPKKHIDKINKTLLLGALVNNVQINTTSEDAASIEQVGEQLYKDTYTHIKVVADLQTAADNVRTREEPVFKNYQILKQNIAINKRTNIIPIKQG